jgi:hypothetical protein
LATYKIISGEDITTALETVIAQPQVKMQINKAKQVYRDAEDIMKGLSDINSSGLGFKHHQEVCCVVGQFLKRCGKNGAELHRLIRLCCFPQSLGAYWTQERMGLAC